MTRFIGVNCSPARFSALVAAALFMAVPFFARAATAQVGFSPEGSARTLVLAVITSAQHDIRMLAYDFTAPDITRALIEAKRRGIDVRVVVDDSANRGPASRAVMNLLTNAGIALRVDRYYKIQHDKAIVVDSNTVETGSFNFTVSAERFNSENAVAVWHYPDFAKPFVAHWESRWSHSKPYQSSY